MVFHFFLSRYQTDFDEKNTVCCKSWLHTLLAHIVHRTSIGYPTVHFPFVRLALATDILWMVYFDPDNGWSRMVILGCPMNIHLVPISDVK
jgi:hypothetical protein